MNEELNHNYTDWKTNIKLDPTWAAPINYTFIPSIIPILASIDLVRNETGKVCPKLTHNNISGTIKTPEGSIAAEQLQALIVFLGLARRSTLLPKTTQTRFPQYGIYTPLVMYAHKLHHNVGYDEWDQTLNPYLMVYLGTTLYEAFASAKKGGQPCLDDIKSLRKEALTYKSGTKAGTMDRSTAHRCNVRKLDVKDKDEVKKKQPYTKYAVMSYLQLWICNVELRDDAMILDLLDWGNKPKALDAVMPKVEPVKIKTDLEQVWELM